MIWRSWAINYHETWFGFYRPPYKVAKREETHLGRCFSGNATCYIFRTLVSFWAFYRFGPHPSNMSDTVWKRWHFLLTAVCWCLNFDLLSKPPHYHLANFSPRIFLLQSSYFLEQHLNFSKHERYLTLQPQQLLHCRFHQQSGRDYFLAELLHLFEFGNSCYLSLLMNWQYLLWI